MLNIERKLFTKIINNRLKNLLIKLKILNSNNWIGLPGNNIDKPIIVLNNIIEDIVKTIKKFQKKSHLRPPPPRNQ